MYNIPYLIISETLFFTFFSEFLLVYNGSVEMNLPANAGATGDMGLTPGLGRPPRGGNGNPLQYSCLENPMGRGAWWATVHGVTKSDMADRAKAHSTE